MTDLMTVASGRPEPERPARPHRMLAAPTRDSLRALRETRARFLSDPRGTTLDGVRDVIAASWRRSVSCKVDPETGGSGVRDVNLDRTLLRVADPVLDRLDVLGHDTGVCAVLSDAQGTIAAMRGDRGVLRWADRNLVSVGSHFPEELTGTNGAGTALEQDRSVQVWGAEHFAESLQSAFCTSVPVRGTLRGRALAVLSLLVPERVALETDPRDLALVVEAAAAEIGRGIVDGLAHREQALLRAYLAEAQTRGGDAVIAYDGRTVIASSRAQQMLGAADHAVVAAYAREAADAGATIERIALLSDDRAIRLAAKPVLADGDTVGSVVRLRPRRDADSLGRSKSRASSHAGPDPEMPTLVGETPAIQAVRREARSAAAHRALWVVGERGTGRSHLAALIARGKGSAHTVEFDPRLRPLGTSAASELEDAISRCDAVVCRNVDLVDEADRARSHELIRTASPRAQIVLTAYEVDADVWNGEEAPPELRMPPLRSRLADVPALVSFFLREFAPGAGLAASSSLVSALTRAHWPGNVRELRNVVRAAAEAASSNVVGVGDLSESHRQAIVRGRLSRLEAAELEQIRHALDEANGHRTLAADILEIGRSTLYRKMLRYAGMGYDLGT